VPVVKPKPEVKSSERSVMEEQVIRGLEKSKLKKELKEGDPDYKDEENEEIPPEVPKLIFMVGGNVIDCKKFELTDTEAKIMANALSILLPKLNSKIYAVIVIVSITGYKISACKEAVQNKVKNMKLGFKMPKNGKTRFDPKRQANVTMTGAKA
jgi:hypothetical protein